MRQGRARGLKVQERQRRQGSWGGGNAGIGVGKMTEGTTVMESDRWPQKVSAGNREPARATYGNGDKDRDSDSARMRRRRWRRTLQRRRRRRRKVALAEDDNEADAIAEDRRI